MVMLFYGSWGRAPSQKEPWIRDCERDTTILDATYVQVHPSHTCTIQPYVSTRPTPGMGRGLGVHGASIRHPAHDVMTRPRVTPRFPVHKIDFVLFPLCSTTTSALMLEFAIYPKQ